MVVLATYLGKDNVLLSLSALLRANSCRVSQWTADTIDEILIEGDAMYVKAFDDDTIPDTEILSLTNLPDRVHWPTMTADRAKPNQLHAHCFNSMCITKYKKLLSTYEPKSDLKVASEDQIIETLFSPDNTKIAYDAIKVLELVINVKIVYFDTESMNFINVLLESAKQKAILNSLKT